MSENNPLSKFYRAPKLFIPLPSRGKFYDDDVMDYPESGELPIYAMTSKDEMIMKNPDALLNGEAVAHVIASCVPCVKQPRKLISNDVDAILIAIQGATYGDEVEVKTNCPECNHFIEATASVESALDTMTVLQETYKFDTPDGLTIEVRPFTYESTIRSGISNFKSTRSMQALSQIEDELEQLHAFNDSFMQMAALNFSLIVDSVASLSGKDDEDEDFVVNDRAAIQDYLENCEGAVGKEIEKQIGEVNDLGVNRKIGLQCDECEHSFTTDIGFDPVNFFTAS